MDHVIDDVARLLAQDMPRRQLFRLVGGVFATAVFAMFAVEPLSANSSRGIAARRCRSCSPGDDVDGDDCDDGGRFGDGRRDERRHHNGCFDDDGICCPRNTCCRHRLAASWRAARRFVCVQQRCVRCVEAVRAARAAGKRCWIERVFVRMTRPVSWSLCLLLVSFAAAYAVFTGGADDTSSFAATVFALGLAGIAGSPAPVPRRSGLTTRRVVNLAALLFLAYVGLQLVPLPIQLLRVISPTRAEIAEALSHLTGSARYAPLTVAPPHLAPSGSYHRVRRCVLRCAAAGAAVALWTVGGGPPARGDWRRPSRLRATRQRRRHGLISGSYPNRQPLRRPHRDDAALRVHVFAVRAEQKRATRRAGTVTRGGRRPLVPRV